MKLRKIKVKCEIEVPFCEYKNKKLNLKAEHFITKWIKETLHNDCSYIPMYIEKTRAGLILKTALNRLKLKLNDRKS